MSILTIVVILAVAAIVIWLINYRMDLNRMTRLILNIVIAVLLVLFLATLLGWDTGLLSKRV